MRKRKGAKTRVELGRASDRRPLLTARREGSYATKGRKSKKIVCRMFPAEYKEHWKLHRH